MSEHRTSFLGAIAGAAASQGTLSDDRFSLRYADLREHFIALDELFGARRVALGDIVALECATSVPGALTLLYLLASEFSVVLLPPRDHAAPAVPVPRFCRRRITVRGNLANGAQDIALRRPDTFLDISDVPDHRLPPGMKARTTGYVFLRTSGSTGQPKLAVYSHGRLLANGLQSLQRTQLDAQDRIAIPVPLSHMFGLGAAFVPGVAASASLRMIEGANALRYPEHERAYLPTVAFLTPALLATLVRPTGTPPAPTPYRHVVVAGDKLSPELFETAEGRFRRVLNLYGTTEMGVIAVADARTEDGPRSTTVGPPLPGVELRLDVRETTGESTELAGAIVCRHPHGFEGYVEDGGEPWTGPPPLTDGWYRTRDLGRLHPGGLLEVLGREDHSVYRDGRLVLLAEIERAMERLPGVARAVTVLGRNGLRGREILAFCAPRDGHELAASHLRDACAGVLPPYAIPDHIVITSALPVLPSGTVDRRLLTDKAAAMEVSVTSTP